MPGIHICRLHVVCGCSSCVMSNRDKLCGNVGGHTQRTREQRKTFRFTYRLSRIVDVLEDFEGADGYRLNILYDSADLSYYKYAYVRGCSGGWRQAQVSYQ